MSDLLSQLSSAVNNASSSANMTQADLLVQSYKKTQQSKVDALKTKKTTLEGRVSFINSLKSKLDNLNSQMDVYSSATITEKFKAKAITSSDTSVANVTSSGDAAVGVNSLYVKRLASNDSLISQRMNISDSFGMATSSISINGFNVNVELTGTETNEEAMKKIVKAINNTEDITFSASYIKDTTSTGRLTFTSKETGESKKITFSDGALATKLGLTSSGLNSNSNSRYATSGAGAFYKTTDPATLNSNVEINGLDVVRESNTIDDLLTGVEISLVKPQETASIPLTLTTSVGTTKVKDLVKPLLDAYNDILSFVKSNPTQMRADTSINGLYSKLRSLPSQGITPLSGTTIGMLSDAGIKADKNGNLSVDDTDKLTDALNNNPEAISNLFTGTDGFVNKLSNSVSNLIGSEGLLVNRSLSLSKQIDSIKQRTVELEDRIDRQAETLRKEYENTLRVFLKAQNQTNLLGTFPSSSY
jgi:flagellar hook-associated protein 2